MRLVQFLAESIQLVFNMNYHLLGKRNPSNMYAWLGFFTEQIISDIPLQTAAYVQQIDF